MAADARRRFDGEPRYVVVAHEDVTEITQAKMELQELAGKMLVAQDEERRRIARELHDATTQQLVAALMTFDAVTDAVIVNDKARAQPLGEVRSLIETSIGELRTLSYVLHPPLLEERGLASALRWFIQGFEKRSGIAVHFACSQNFRKPAPEVERALFRIVQEALTNVHRHSKSATARVRLSQGTGDIVLEVSDQGTGMANSQSPADAGSLGVGISGMRARLRQLGGTLELRSTRAGTTVLARIPAGTAERPIRIMPGVGQPRHVLRLPREERSRARPRHMNER
jgi:two-component system NarL family sensor kinase